MKAMYVGVLNMRSFQQLNLASMHAYMYPIYSIRIEMDDRSSVAFVGRLHDDVVFCCTGS